MKRILRLILAVCLLAGASAQVAVGAEWILNETTGNEYKLLDNCGTWQACEDAAVQQDAHLVTINDAAEQVWITDTFGCFTIQDCSASVGEKTKDFWIGLRCEGEHCWECWGAPPGSNPDAWFWISGEEYDYSNWVANCTLLYPDGPYVVGMVK